jgi:ferric-dicitrate binding protein FerR (iron transport regulator)
MQPKLSDQRIEELAHKYANGTIPESEKTEFDHWYQAQNDKQFYHSQAREPEALRDRLYQPLQEVMRESVKRRVLIWPRLVAAASILLVLGTGTLIYFNQHKKHGSDLAQVHDIAPGKQGATLTLASGKRIRLGDAANGELAKEAGMEISKSRDGQLVYKLAGEQKEEDRVNTLATANGETYQVVLPDGSHVWLNSASSLTYNASLLKDGKRSVRLSGEGYFEVAKDKSHPFIVEAGAEQVEVLGTHFNVNSYSDEPVVATTLLEGSVRVSAGKAVRTIVPGEQAAGSAGGIKVARVNTESVVDWKEGEFNLEDVDFRVAMRKIARWYDVEVVYDQSVPEHIESWGLISRSSKLSAVTRLIENSGQVRFRLEGKKLYVFK